jgi:two-component system response regulator FixJ
MPPEASRLVHVVDDEEPIRRSLALLLGAARFGTTVHPSGDAFLEAAPDLAPGCVLLDLRMPGLDGLAVLREVGRRGLGWPVIVISAHGDVPLAVEAMKAGACDFLEKPCSAVALTTAVEAALRRGEGERARAREAEDAAARVAALTPREAQVLQGLVAGQQNKVIAIHLGLSPRTVEIHRANLMARLGVRSLSEAVRLALLAGVGEQQPPVDAGPQPRVG